MPNSAAAMLGTFGKSHLLPASVSPSVKWAQMILTSFVKHFEVC